MKRVILLDADVPAYQFAARGQKEIDWGDTDDEGSTEWSKVAPPEAWAFDNMHQSITDLREELNADRIILMFSDAVRSNNWRLDVLPTYKWKRDASTRPLLHGAMEAELDLHYENFRRDTLEGDDLLGIIATDSSIIKGEKIIVSIDKDLKTIPSRQSRGSFNTLVHVPKYGKGKEVTVTESEADWYWMYQTLIGDTTDGYKGLPGCGPVGAYKIIGSAADDRTVEDLWQDVVEAYLSKKLSAKLKAELGVDELTEAHALQQAQVARIARAEDYNRKTKRVMPWVPGR